jgi:Ni/Fe-hydrogenase subunit HybB-like protein
VSAQGFIDPAETYETIGQEVAAVAFDHPGWQRWWLAFLGGIGLLGLLAIMLIVLLWKGVGIWGNNIPVTWALDIVSYDWWIGIASGGLILSATMLLLGYEWRGAINRIAETMALVSACAAAIYPIIHLGRPWFFYWNLPYPNTMLLWPQLRSPLYWDAIDILSYLLICASFWYIGLLPDLATMRDRAFERAAGAGGRGLIRAQLYGIAALGWRGSAVHWQRWSQAYRTIGLLGVILVVSLQSGAAVMFAGTVEPGWHDTLLPVAFLCAAIFAGLGAIALLAVIMRSVFALQSLMTERHLDVLGKLLLGLGLINLYCYAIEFFNTALGGDPYEMAVLGRRLHGPHAWAFWAILICALVPVQLFWVPRLRRAPLVLAAVGLLVTVGMWADHFMVIVVTLQQDFLPSSNHPYSIGLWGLATFAGSFGLFLCLLLLGLRYLPVISFVETRQLTRIAAPRDRGPQAHNPHDAPIWGVSAEFGSAAAVLSAAEAMRLDGHHRLDLYSPVPLAAAPAALALPEGPIPPCAVAGVVIGFIAMFGMCTYATLLGYAFNIGGRPRFSWPSFVIPSVSFAMMTGAIGVMLALLVLNRLPRLNHPAFNIPGFYASTQDKFFLVVEARHEDFDPAAVERAFRTQHPAPVAIHWVPR